MKKVTKKKELKVEEFKVTPSSNTVIIEEKKVIGKLSVDFSSDGLNKIAEKINEIIDAL